MGILAKDVVLNPEVFHRLDVQHRFDDGSGVLSSHGPSDVVSVSVSESVIRSLLVADVPRKFDDVVQDHNVLGIDDARRTRAAKLQHVRLGASLEVPVPTGDLREDIALNAQVSHRRPGKLRIVAFVHQRDVVVEDEHVGELSIGQEDPFSHVDCGNVMNMDIRSASLQAEKVAVGRVVDPQPPASLRLAPEVAAVIGSNVADVNVALAI